MYDSAKFISNGMFSNKEIEELLRADRIQRSAFGGDFTKYVKAVTSHKSRVQRGKRRRGR